MEPATFISRIRLLLSARSVPPELLQVCPQDPCLKPPQLHWIEPVTSIITRVQLLAAFASSQPPAFLPPLQEPHLTYPELPSMQTIICSLPIAHATVFGKCRRMVSSLLLSEWEPAASVETAVSRSTQRFRARRALRWIQTAVSLLPTATITVYAKYRPTE